MAKRTSRRRAAPRSSSRSVSATTRSTCGRGGSRRSPRPGATWWSVGARRRESANDELRKLDKQLQKLATEINSGIEHVRQGDLFAGDNVSGRVGQADAEAALGDIAARTEGPMGGRAAAGAAAAAAQGGNGAAGNHDFEAADPPREVTPETEREDELADARGSARGARGLEKVREFQERRDAETGGAA